VRIFLERGYNELDTANRYCGGLTEEILGRILVPQLREKVFLGTKISPEVQGGGLKPAKVVEQVETSLRRLKTDCVDLLYLHAPDPMTPIEETLEACHALYLKGKFREFGLSNFAAWQVVDIWHKCDRNGWVIPVTYQGMYNAITRSVETELFPAIWFLKTKFYAYNPLAGGFLTGRYVDIDKKPVSGRFSLKKAYLDRYWKAPYFEAIQIVRSICQEHSLDPADCALRWMKHHSFIKGERGDGVIIGGANVEQFERNLQSCDGEILPDEVVTALDRAWDIVRYECPQYFRESQRQCQ
jgi:aflatoxin B1 aldehyde reductase